MIFEREQPWINVCDKSVSFSKITLKAVMQAVRGSDQA